MVPYSFLAINLLLFIKLDDFGVLDLRDELRGAVDEVAGDAVRIFTPESVVASIEILLYDHVFLFLFSDAWRYIRYGVVRVPVVDGDSEGCGPPAPRGV